MDNILDHVVVQGQRYDIVSPTAFGDYIETIGSACINPDGYAQGSTFLAKFGNEQFYYEATAAITQGSAISEGTNCKRTTVTEREAELAADINSLNIALTNEVTTRAALGTHNLLQNQAQSISDVGIVATVNSDGTILVSGTATSTFVLTLFVGSMAFDEDVILSGCPSGGGLTTYGLDTDPLSYYETGNGVVIPAGTTITRVRMRIGAGTAISSPITFKPMIRLATDTDPTYQPYAMTNRELTDAVALSSETIATGLNVYKSGHVINIRGTVSIQNSSLTIGTRYQIATLDNKYKPNESFIADSKAHHYIDGITTYYKDAIISIMYNGALYVIPQELSSSSATEFAINITYLV